MIHQLTKTQPWKDVFVPTRLLEKGLRGTDVMILSEEVYWRVDDKGGTLDGTPAGTKVVVLSKLVPSGNLLSRESSCNMKSRLS